MRLLEVAASRVRFGYRRLTVLLRRDGWRVNAKRIYRLYTEEGLVVRTKLRVKAARRTRVPQAVATVPNQRWSLDLMSARVADGRWFRILTVLDQFSANVCACSPISPSRGRRWPRPRTPWCSSVARLAGAR
jgi:putative transposase